MFGSARLYNVDVGFERKDRQDPDQLHQNDQNLRKRNSHPMFQHPIQNAKRDSDYYRGEKLYRQRQSLNDQNDAIEIEGQLSQGHKKFLQEFKLKSLIITNQNQNGLAKSIKTDQNQPEKVIVQFQEFQQKEYNQKGKLATRFSKIDELSQQYLSSKANSQTLKFSYQKRIPSMESERDKNRKIKMLKSSQQHPSQLENYCQIKLGQSEVIDLTKTTKDRYSNNNQNSINIQVQPYLTSKKDTSPSLQFATELFKGLGIINSTQANMHQDIIIQIAKNRFQQLKQNGKWQTIKQNIQMSNLFDSDQHQENKAQKLPSTLSKKKSSFRSNSKKVRVISPQTISQFDRKRELLQKQLIRCTQILTHGFSLKKYCYNNMKIQNVRMVFSFDFGFFALKAEDKSKPTIHSMSEFTGIISGCKSKNFKRYNEIENISFQKAFTITFSDRTFDFACECMSERDQIVSVIKIMKNSTS